MITNTMTATEIHKEMRSEWAELTHLDDKFRANGGWRQARDPRARFPMTIIHEHKTSRNNRYLLQNVIISRKEALQGRASLFIRALVDSDDGISLFMQNCGDDGKPTVFAFRPHLFSRYKERMGLDKNGVELIRHFIRRNTFFIWEESYRRSKDNTDDIMVSCYDGAVFGQYYDEGDVNFFDMRTFVANDTMDEGYKAKFNSTYNAGIRCAAMKAMFNRKMAHVVSHTAKLRKEKK